MASDATPIPPIPAPEPLTLEKVANHRHSALGQIDFIRKYLLEMLGTIPTEKWKEIPAGAPTHLAWQVGHIAVAEYGLLLFRQRGRAVEDLDLMPGWLRKKYGKGSTPTAESQETPEQLLEALHRIHECSIRTIMQLPLEQFLEPIDMPYAFYPN